MHWRFPRYTAWVATHPFLGGLAIFAAAAAACAVFNVGVLHQNWPDWSLWLAITMGILTVLHVWQMRSLHRWRRNVGRSEIRG